MANQYYKKYSKQTKPVQEKPGYLKLFLGAFSMMLVLFVLLAVHLFSSVDTAIGENDEGDLKESGLGVKHLIDSRLKFLQLEDKGQLPTNKVPAYDPSKEISTYASDGVDEVKVEPYRRNENTNYNGNNNFTPAQTTYSDNTVKHQTISTPAPVTQQPRVANNVYKVYIGSYSTLEQARVAQNIIQDANLGVTSFVKSTPSGAYTIQVGSYTDYTKAVNLANELKRNHFPARMVQE